MKSELILRENLSDVIFISNRKTPLKLHKENIQFLEAKEDKVMIHSIKGNYLQNCSLTEFLNHFKDDHEFVRISDTRAVNLSYVDSIIHYTLFMDLKDFKVAEKYRESIFGCN